MHAGTNQDLESLEIFLAGNPPISRHQAEWANGEIRLAISTHLLEGDTPPTNLVTSGRCLVFAPAGVLVMTNPGERHVTPGGRLEPGEDPRAATIREVNEEAGVRLTDLRPFALNVYRHLTPRPDDYPFPYPVFTNLIFVSQLDVTPELATVIDDYELGAEFVPVTRTAAVIHPHARPLLTAAVNHLSRH